jgi:curved DNA-binding protein CbpA
MTEANAEGLDYYEILQVNQSADSQTIERVFRLLAKRFHPDNRETGDPERFNLVVEAFRVLSDPEERVNYDARYERLREHQWQVLDQESAGDDVEADRRIRLGILSLLYTTRRQDVHQPGLGTFELERLLGCPEHHMQFHMWYLKENRWIERMDNGKFAITVSGVDKLVETDIPWRQHQALLPSGSEDSDDSDDDGDASSDRTHPQGWSGS